MSIDGFEITGEREIFAGHMLRLVDTSVVIPDGSTVSREIVRHPGAVAVVAIDDVGNVLLERQYRAALDNDLLEIPAGKLDVADEPVEAAARRELLEETGFEAARWTRLVSFYNSPGFADEHSTLFLAEELTEVGHDLQGPEEQAMVVRRVPLVDTWDLIASGELVDAKSIIGLLLAMRHLDQRS